MILSESCLCIDVVLWPSSRGVDKLVQWAPIIVDAGMVVMKVYEACCGSKGVIILPQSTCPGRYWITWWSLVVSCLLNVARSGYQRLYWRLVTRRIYVAMTMACCETE